MAGEKTKAVEDPFADLVSSEPGKLASAAEGVKAARKAGAAKGSPYTATSKRVAATVVTLKPKAKKKLKRDRTIKQELKRLSKGKMTGEELVAFSQRIADAIAHKPKKKDRKKPKRAHGVRSQEKGKVGERAVANKFKDRWPVLCVDARRGNQARDGSDCSDVEGVPGLWVESKKERQNNVRDTLKQMKEDCKDGRIQVAVIKDDGEPPFVVMPQESLFRILNEESFAERDQEALRLRSQGRFKPGAESVR